MTSYVFMWETPEGERKWEAVKAESVSVRIWLHDEEESK